MNALKLEKITKSFNGRVVLTVDELSIANGECIALVGPNGSGKTTLMAVAALLIQPDTGSVAIDGEIVNWRFPDKHRRKITLVAQEPYFFKGSLMRNMMFGLNGLIWYRKDLTARINSYLEFLELQNLAKHTPSKFSTGEKKRAAIARALCRDAKIFLLDEPFANVDNQSVLVIQNVIKKLIRHKTIMFSTHELSHAYNLADKIITLNDGHFSPWSPENLYMLTAKTVPDGTELLTQSGMPIYYPRKLVNGKKYKLTINPKEVIISINAIESSAQNRFNGIIQKIESAGENLALVKIECDSNFVISSIVTSRTIKSFNCTVGDTVWVSFKSAAVHVFE